MGVKVNSKRPAEPGFRLLGDVRGMIVEDQLDRRAGWVGGVEELQEFNEFATAVAVFHQGIDLAGHRVDAGQQADRAEAPGSGGKSGAVVAIAWIPGFSS